MNTNLDFNSEQLVYTGQKTISTNIPIVHYTYNEKSFKKNSFVFDKEFSINLNPINVNWLHIGGIHNPELIKKIGESFNIDSLILEDLLNSSQRPKLETRDDFIFITLKMISKNNSKFEYEQVSFILFPNLLISFQENPHDPFDIIRDKVEKGISKLKSKKEGYLTYSLIDRIVDNYFLIIEDLEEQLDSLEMNVITNPKKKDFQEILELKKEILKFKKAISPLKELSSKFKDSDIKEYLGEEIDIYLKDLQDHIVIVSENTESIFSRGSELLQLYHSTISNGMNEIMKVLTMISTIFIPLSFLAGVYGMNFSYMPILSWHYGYFALLGVMIFIFLGTAFFFRKKKWW